MSPRFARPSTNTIVRLRRARPQHNIAAIRWPRLKVPLQSPFDSTSCRLQIAVFGLTPPPTPRWTAQFGRPGLQPP